MESDLEEELLAVTGRRSNVKKRKDKKAKIHDDRDDEDDEDDEDDDDDDVDVDVDDENDEDTERSDRNDPEISDDSDKFLDDFNESDSNEIDSQDQNDQDYYKSKSKWNSSRNLKNKTKNKKRSAASSSAPTQADARAKRKKKNESDDNNEIDDDVFVDEYDTDGFKDEDDRQKLMSMNDLQREEVLAERFEQKQRRKEAWDLEKMLRKERKKSAKSDADYDSKKIKGTSKKAALDALAARKSKSDVHKSRDTSMPSESDDGSDFEAPLRKDTPKVSKDHAPNNKSADHKEKKFHDRYVEYGDIVEGDETTRVYIRKTQLLMHLPKPAFNKLVEGMFTRFSDGMHPGTKQPKYKFGRIIDAKDDSKIYVFGKFKTGKKLRIDCGDETARTVSLIRISTKRPTQEEFDEYINALRARKRGIPQLSDLEEISDKVRKFQHNKLKVDREETDRHEKIWKTNNPEAVNSVLLIEEAKKELRLLESVPKDRRDAKKIQEKQNQILQLQKLTERLAQKASSETKSVLKTMFSKNRQNNSLIDKIAATRKNLEMKIGSQPDPFARLESRGTSYFSIKPSSKDNTVVVQNQSQRSLAPLQLEPPDDEFRNLPSLNTPNFLKSRKQALDIRFEIDLDVLDDMDQQLQQVAAVRTPLIPPGVDIKAPQPVHEIPFSEDFRVLKMKDYLHDLC